MPDNVIPEAALLRQLPPVPERFESRLADVFQMQGYPMFRLVDGQRELQWRNDGYEVKHIFYPQDEKGERHSCYIPVLLEMWRRKDIKSGEYKVYSSYKDARDDKDKHLAIDIDYGRKVEVRTIGKPCWVVEVFIEPSDRDKATWDACRYDYLESMGITRKVDLLGPYPNEGRYMWCFDVIDDDGNAISPSERTLDECRRRVRLVMGDTSTTEQRIQCDENAIKRFEAKQLQEMNENFFQWAGITATRAKAGVVSKPIGKVMEGR